MQRRFKSGISIEIVLPLAFLLTGVLIGMILLSLWTAAIFFFLLIVLIGYLFANTDYTIVHRQTLKIRSGFLIRKEINIDQITRIKATRNLLAAPALSLDRLEICYKKFDSAIISPREKNEFITVLKQINPAIEVEF